MRVSDINAGSERNRAREGRPASRLHAESRVFGATVTDTDGRSGGAEALRRSRSRQRWVVIVESLRACGCRRTACRDTAIVEFRAPPAAQAGPLRWPQWRCVLSIVKKSRTPTKRKGLDKNTPHGRFILWVLTTSTSLNLRAVLKRAIARSGMDASARAISGLTPSAQALLVAGAAQTLPNGVVLFIVPGDGDLEQAVADVAFFVAALDGLSPSAADRAVLPFPSHEVDPYRGLAPHIGVTSARARALHAIATGPRASSSPRRRRFCRASARRDALLAASLELRPGQEIAPTDLAELLVDAGFTPRGSGRRARRVRDPRRHRRHLPAGRRAPVRLEFIGDTIESLRTYDPSTQRSIAADRSGRDRAAARRARAAIGERDALRLSRAREGRAGHRLGAGRGRSERREARRAASAELRGRCAASRAASP